jgi:hypothetical protein
MTTNTTFNRHQRKEQLKVLLRRKNQLQSSQLLADKRLITLTDDDVKLLRSGEHEDKEFVAKFKKADKLLGELALINARLTMLTNDLSKKYKAINEKRQNQPN